jgi:putative methionine-R-sulfoxide reductase with GAF domain
MKSSIVVPVFVQGRSIGLLGLNAFSRPLEYPLVVGDRLQIIADMIGSMMVRIQ